MGCPRHDQLIRAVAGRMGQVGRSNEPIYSGLEDQRSIARTVLAGNCGIFSVLIPPVRITEAVDVNHDRRPELHAREIAHLPTHWRRAPV